MRKTMRTAVVLMWVLLLFSTSNTLAEENVLGKHTVLPGETLYCIGRAYRVDPWAIATQNRIVNINLIYPGAILEIPNAPAALPAGPTCARQFASGGSPTPTCGACTCQQEHIIATGDTLTQIGARYGVDVSAVVQCNCLADPNYIRIGDSLCIP